MKAALSILAATFIFLVPVQGQDAAKKEVAKLKGEWKIEQIDLGPDQKLPPEALAMFKFKITDDRFIVEVAGQKQEAIYKVDPTKSPKQIDITPQEGPNKDKVGKGIYTLEGDTLKICHSEKGDGRPTEFKVDKETKTGIITLKRIKQ